MATRIEFHKHGGPEVLQAVEFTPANPAENEIQVENKAIGINFIDTYIRSGLYPPPSLPSGLGTEAAGIVSKVGSGVKHIKAGDRVVYAQSALGAYSSVHNIIADKAAILPAAISFEQAAASFLKGLTVYYLLRKTYEIKPDEQFLFHAAAGGVGLIACQWAKALGAKLIGTVGTAQKAQSALKAGAGRLLTIVKRIWSSGLKRDHPAVRKCAWCTIPWAETPGNGRWIAMQRRGLMVSFGNSSGAVPV